jgi:hypothetical protein
LPHSENRDTPPDDPAQRVLELEDGLYKARRTSQKRGRRVSELKDEIAGLRAERAGDKLMLHRLLSDAFESRGPWITGARIDGKVYGRATRHASPRLGEFFQAFPEASRGRVLEPGSLEGAMTIELAKRASEVVGLEGREASVERSEFLKGIFEARNVSFRLTNLEQDDLSSYGVFDAMFCCGILYHLAHPRVFVERMAAVSPNLYLDTQYARPGWDLVRREGLWGWVRSENSDDPQSGLSGTAFWPTLEELHRLLYESGYESIETLALPPDNRHGPRVHLAARRF